jgi:hypothetical protein
MLTVAATSAGDPYPGYVGNWAGPIGAGAAMAIGLFDCLESVASQPMGVWDIVPADLVASSIIAAAAAISAGVAASISRATRSGSIVGSAADAAVVLGQPHPFSPAARAAQLQQVAEQHAGLTGSPDLSPTIKVGAEHGLKPLKSAAAAGDRKTKKAAGRAMSAASDDTAMYPGGRVSSLADLTAMEDSSGDSSGDSSSSSSSSSPKMRSNPTSRAPQSSKLTQQLLAAVNVASATEDSNSSDELASEGLSDGEPRLPLLIVHAATSSTYPLVLMEGWNYNLDFFDAHPPPFR